MHRRGREERGQAAVEVALVLPLVMLLALLLLQVALVLRDQVLVTHAAREAAREAAVSAGQDLPRRAALAGTDLREDRVEVEVGRRGAAGSRVRVEVRYRAPTNLPIIGPMVGDVELSGATTMRVEK